MILIPLPFSDSKLLMPILFFFVLSLCFISGVQSESNPIIQLRIDPDIDDVDPCRGSDSRPISCPIKCFRTDPVCGVDGVTYWCGCEDARCAGTKVAKRGFCEVGNNGAAAQALLLLHIVWLIVHGFSVLFGLF